VEALARKGWKAAILDDPGLAKGVNVLSGEVVYSAVAQAHRLTYSPLDQAI
jgi:alanine dehydrogenase